MRQVKGFLLPGDVVEVDGDATYPGNVTFYHGGTKESPVTVRGVRVNGRRPILTGTTITNLANVMAIRTNYMIIEGFEVDGAMNAFVYRGLYNVGDHNVFRDMLVHDCPNHGVHGSDISGSLTLDHVEVHHCGAGLGAHQIYINSGNLNHPDAVFLMQFCFVHDGNGGNSVKTRVPSRIYYNWIEGSPYHELDLIGADSAAQAPGTSTLVREDADIVGNVIYKTASSDGAVGRWGSDGVGLSRGRYRFMNNTVVLARDYRGGDILRLRGPIESVEMHNNVLYQIGGKPIRLLNAEPVPASFTGTNNWLPVGSTSGAELLSGTIWGADPRFGNAEAFDFMPTNGSPLLDTASLPTRSPEAFPFPSPLEEPLFIPPLHTTPAPFVDTQRVPGTPPDIGALEAPVLPPGFSAQPQSLTRLQRDMAIFLVTASSSLMAENPLQYQWYFNGAAISDATNCTYSIAAVEAADAGRYCVVASNALGSARSDEAVLTVILDTTKPVAVILVPYANSDFSVTRITVSGNAVDNIRVSQVLVSLNGGTPVLANVFNRSPSLADWQSDVTLAPGTNTVYVKAVDYVGNESSVVSRHIFLRVPVPLTVEINGAGQVLPNLNGSNLFVGRTYTVRASPGADASGNVCLFTNWVNSLTGVVTTDVRFGWPVTNSIYSFVMQSNLTLTANFVPNRFVAAAGVYCGLFQESEGVRESSAGWFMVTTDARLRYTGKLRLDGNTFAFSGVFDLDGNSTSRPILRKGKDTLFVKLALDLDGNKTITGMVTNPAAGWGSAMLGDKQVTDVSAFAGTYTLLIPGTNDPAHGPAGSGYGLVTVKTNGLVVMTGALGDGHAFSPATAAVSKDGYWPVYAPLYIGSFSYSNPSPGGAYKEFKGLITGWLRLDQATHTASLTGDLVWIKPAWTNTILASGFTNTVPAAGGAFTPGSNLQLACGMTDGTLVLEGSGLNSVLTNYVSVLTNKFLNATLDAWAAKISLKGITGLISVSFKNPDNAFLTTRATGAVWQDQRLGMGYFIGGTGCTNTGCMTLREH